MLRSFRLATTARRWIDAIGLIDGHEDNCDVEFLRGPASEPINGHCRMITRLGIAVLRQPFASNWVAMIIVQIDFL